MGSGSRSRSGTKLAKNIYFFLIAPEAFVTFPLKESLLTGGNGALFLYNRSWGND